MSTGDEGKVGVPTALEEDEVLDLRERSVAEAKLRAADAKYRNLVEHLPAVTYIEALEGGGPTLFISPQVESMLGYTPTEWVDDPELWARTIHPDDRDTVLADVAQAANEGRSFSAHYRMNARDGRTVWCHERAGIVRDDLGVALFRQGIMFDMTDTLELQREGKELSTLISGDVLASIGTLRNLVVSLERQWSELEDESRRRIVQWIETETGRLRDLADRAVESSKVFDR